MVEVRVEDCYSDTEGNDDDDDDDDESGDGFGDDEEDEGSFLQDYDQLLSVDRKVETQITPSGAKQQPSQLQAAAHFQILDQDVTH